MNVIKRDGIEVEFDYSRIVTAIGKAVLATYGETENYEQIKERKRNIKKVAFQVHMDCEAKCDETNRAITVEEIQDIVERELMHQDMYDVAKSYITYREQRSKFRDMNNKIMKAVNEITFTDSADSNLKRENGNVDTDGPMGKMLKMGGEVGKAFTEGFIMKPDHAKAHRAGDIHVHDEDFMSTGTQTCCQIDADKLITGGFSTGHGYLREPNHIKSYSALACIAIQANQNSQHK